MKLMLRSKTRSQSTNFPLRKVLPADKEAVPQNDAKQPHIN